MTTITIIGDHGKVALRTAPLLKDLGHTVKSVIRDESQSTDITAAGATPVIADIEHLDQAGIADLLTGSDAVIWSAGAAEQAGARRFGMVSYFNSRLVDGQYPEADEDDGMYAYYNAKSQADEHLRTSTDLEWSVIGPSVLTLDEPTGKITVDESGEQRDLDVPATSRANVAAVIEEPDSGRKTLSFHDGDTPIAEAVTQGRWLSRRGQLPG